MNVHSLLALAALDLDPRGPSDGELSSAEGPLSPPQHAGERLAVRRRVSP